jgi:4-hydroxy-2-oxoheptanedioate aldolase
MRWGQSMREYLDTADYEVLAIAVIEHHEAVEHAAEIARTPGLDVVVIGPGDLATSMGLHGRADHPDVQAAIARIEQGVKGSGVGSCADGRAGAADARAGLPAAGDRL